ncbi:retinol dehydrogenase 8-like [Podarcis raffonei]|uniref:retinol dehydrogenase 8-like n=1 Tax=Podarcis raffonei TaxID=65483 RepID=UPI002329692D|nr:retinol dehydrogenase 8-like [Podarcis raffonei]
MSMLNARSVLVTGSNRGIGLELVKQLVEKSNRPEWIFATCRDPEGPGAQALKNLAAKHEGVVINPLDTCEPNSIKAAAARVTECLKGAGLNLLINNAGIVRPASMEDETPESMSEVYRTNVIGPMVVTQVRLSLDTCFFTDIPQHVVELLSYGEQNDLCKCFLVMSSLFAECFFV